MPESLERYLDEQLDGLKQQGLLRSFRILEGPQGARARIDGQDVINLSSNNYLGLTNHPRLKQAALGAILAEDDLVISDELNHASIIDGIRLTKAARRVYAHTDTAALEQVLKQTRGQYAKT